MKTYEQLTTPRPFELPELGALYNHMERTGGRLKLKTIGRNDPCVCQSGLKLKKCCGEFPRSQFFAFMDFAEAMYHSQKTIPGKYSNPTVR